MRPRWPTCGRAWPRTAADPDTMTRAPRFALSCLGAARAVVALASLTVPAASTDRLPRTLTPQPVSRATTPRNIIVVAR